MFVRKLAVRLSILTAIAVLAVLAFTAARPAHKADATGLQPACTFATPIQQLVQQGGGADSVTCTFTIAGNAHTLVVDFTLTPGATPPLSVQSCTLDTNAIHIGPCP